MQTVVRLVRDSGLPALEARSLLALVLQVSRERLIAHPADVVEADAAERFNNLVARRLAGEPLAYLLGEREFYGRVFRVTPAVLVPRPETELLVDLALARAQATQRPRFLDLGTGSGCIAISLALERPDADVTGVDRSEQALAIARDNARRLGARVAWQASDWYARVQGRFDLIVANPPYIAEGDSHLAALSHEPAEALVAPDGGLGCLQRIITDARAHLATSGWLLVEHGYEQAPATLDLFARAGFKHVECVRDAAGLPRVVVGSLA